MITVLSGQPGNGKTSWVINEIKRELEKGRVIYTCGIPKIDLPVIPISRGQLVSWSEREILPHELDDDGEPIYRLTPVSYTHLDVYKRQDLRNSKRVHYSL